VKILSVNGSTQIAGSDSRSDQDILGGGTGGGTFPNSTENPSNNQSQIPSWLKRLGYSRILERSGKQRKQEVAATSNLKKNGY
jgi:hypothetical protein